MNKKLWIFGDSFSNLFYWTQPDYHKLKNGNAKIFCELLSEKLNLELMLNSTGGHSNESIFLSFVRELDKIENDDIVIVNWTEPLRFRLINNNGYFMDINTYHFNDYEEYEIDDISKNTIRELLVHRGTKNYTSVLCDYIKIINKSLPENQIIHWSWINFNGNVPLTIDYMDLKTIKDETKGQINDAHYNDESHFILFEVFDKLIENN